MNTDDLKRITDNPEHIPGIHNYCDRWCEKCPHTDKCSVYAIEQEEMKDEPDPELDKDKQISLDKLQDMLRLTMAMVREQAEEAGIDLEKVTKEDKAKVRNPRNQAKNHPCVKQAKSYRTAVGDWMDRVKPVLKEKGEAMETEARLDLPGQDVDAEFLAMKDAFEIIQWYYIFIGVKLVRAASQDDEEIIDDRLGCTKVALIAMDRSLKAWAKLQEHLPEEADTILDFLAQLDRLRKATETWQPEARNYIRKGLDDIK